MKYKLIFIIDFISMVAYIFTSFFFSRIANDFSFDDDMAAHGCEVHSFDPRLGL